MSTAKFTDVATAAAVLLRSDLAIMSSNRLACVGRGPYSRKGSAASITLPIEAQERAKHSATEAQERAPKRPIEAQERAANRPIEAQERAPNRPIEAQERARHSPTEAQERAKHSDIHVPLQRPRRGFES